MSAELEVVLDDRTLDELVVLIREEIAASDFAFKTSIEHAIHVGEYLNAARDLIPLVREWTTWLADTFPELNYFRLRSYMRLAKYKDQVISGGYHSIQDALVGLTGQPALNRRIQPAEVLELRRDGFTYKAIGEQLGFTQSAVCNAIKRTPTQALKERQAKSARDKRAARLAERLEKQDAEVKRRGGSSAEAYALIRRAAQALESAVANEVGLEARKSLNAAMAALYNAEDRIGHAMRNEYQQSMPSRHKRGLETSVTDA